MRTVVFSAKPHDRDALLAAGGGHAYEFLLPALTAQTAPLAAGAPAVCLFVNDCADREVLAILARGGTRAVVLRCAGYDQVDLAAAAEFGIAVARVPAYSPHATAEHAIGLLLTLNRRLHRATARVREGNFALDGLLGMDLHGKTAGVIGTGRIGAATARILLGFGCEVLATDPVPDPAVAGLGVRYVGREELLAACHIVTLHAPLTPSTRHLIDAAAIARMRPGALLVNTSRGALVDTAAAIAGLKSGRLGGLALDVYEREAGLFFEDWSNAIIRDDVFARLLTFPNVVVTGHQAFFTREAMAAIAAATGDNLARIERGEPCPNLVVASRS